MNDEIDEPTPADDPAVPLEGAAASSPAPGDESESSAASEASAAQVAGAPVLYGNQGKGSGRHTFLLACLLPLGVLAILFGICITIVVIANP